ncbi:hypothetical protein [Algoriphagus halophilus]|uniref:DUF1648 domain-containing protein n=1 Tax=Algoriphagus halophilus TaxID=226505 RepID=A0A1N6FNH2_9BACT|nr:hypothetical protein [Algoriphagus halophilus]SIN96857.1 hypothetical protein SAMN05444394_2590 [Algoriphagus halophilus]
MNSLNTLDPAKGLAHVAIRVFQVLSVLILCLSVYLIYLSYLDLLPDWEVSNHYSGHDDNWSSNSNTWQMLIFAVPGIIAIAFFFLLGYLGKVIQKE